MTDILWIIMFSSIVLMFLAIAYIAMLAVSNKRLVTEQQSKIDEIQKQEERYKALFNNTVVGMFSFSLTQWRVFDINKSLLDKLELTNQHEFQNIFRSMISNVEKTLLNNLRSSQSFQDCEIFYTTKSGKQLVFLFSGREDASDHNIHSVLIDITEKRRLEESFIRAQKMEALSLLTGSIVHDLQNIFAPIQLSLKLLETQVRSQRGKKILKATKSSANEGQLLVGNILSIAKGGKKDFGPININGLFKTILHSFHPGKAIKVQYRNSLKKSGLIVNGNENQLKQMFLNILRNSKEAIQKKGQITITIEEKREKAISYVTVTITDNGEGIPADDLQKVLEPFYTTKKDSGGTGLGLSMVAEIAKQHSGSISIDSKEGVGTTIVVSLPTIQQR